jgi:hypothetical protein
MTLSSWVAHPPSRPTLKSHPQGWVVNGMVKGVVSPRPLAPNLVEDSAPSFRPAATVTTYAAAGVSVVEASASTGFGGCAAMTARKAGTPPLLLRTP